MVAEAVDVRAGEIFGCAGDDAAAFGYQNPVVRLVKFGRRGLFECVEVFCGERATVLALEGVDVYFVEPAAVQRVAVEVVVDLFSIGEDVARAEFFTDERPVVLLLTANRDILTERNLLEEFGQTGIAL